MYRVTHLLSNLGCVDFDLGCSTILPSPFCQIPTSLSRIWQTMEQSKSKSTQPGDWSPVSSLSIKINNAVGTNKSFICNAEKILGDYYTPCQRYHWYYRPRGRFDAAQGP